jgi:hypothetical protein
MPKKKEKEKKDAGRRKGKGLLFPPCPVFFLRRPRVRICSSLFFSFFLLAK